jgi:polyhydroxyalkanoate synthesis regulator phasin
MPDNDLLRRYMDAGVAFTQLTRQRAESIVRDLVRSGEVSRDQATARVEELLERSRQNTDAVLSIVRKEIDDRISQLNLMNRDEVTNLLNRFGISSSSVRKAAARGRSTVKKAARRPSGATKKSASKAGAAKKTAAKKASAAKKATTTTRKTAAKKVTAAKSTAKKSASKAGTAAKSAAAKTSSAASSR